jgi:hypothetical protein
MNALFGIGTDDFSNHVRLFHPEKVSECTGGVGSGRKCLTVGLDLSWGVGDGLCWIKEFGVSKSVNPS